MPRSMTQSRMTTIAARLEDIDTETGQERKMIPGFILCERTQQRQNLRPHSSKFVVRPWEVDQVRLVMRGFDPLVSGDGGTNNDGRPLFIAAAAKFPERKDEFMAQVAKIDANRENERVEMTRPPPTAIQQRAAEKQLLVEGISEGLAGRDALKAELRAELEAEIAAEAEPAKRGPGRPRKDATPE